MSSVPDWRKWVPGYGNGGGGGEDGYSGYGGGRGNSQGETLLLPVIYVIDTIPIILYTNSTFFSLVLV